MVSDLRRESVNKIVILHGPSEMALKPEPCEIAAMYNGWNITLEYNTEGFFKFRAAGIEANYKFDCTINESARTSWELVWKLLLKDLHLQMIHVANCQRINLQREGVHCDN